MKEFDLDLLIGKGVAVNCKTKDEEEEFLKYLDRYNIKWSNGCDIFKTNEYYFDEYTENTCFAFEINKGLIFGILGYWRSINYEIISLDDLVIKPKNNFKDYGFEADFKGEILRKTKHNIYIGYVVDGIDTEYAIEWNSKGDNLLSSRFDKNFNLKPIKKEWFENPDIFEAYKGKLIINEYGVVRRIQSIDINKVSTAEQNMYHDILKVEKWRLVTKEDINQLIFDGDK